LRSLPRLMAFTSLRRSIFRISLVSLSTITIQLIRPWS
jgi:hypothetical protein